MNTSTFYISWVIAKKMCFHSVENNDVIDIYCDEEDDLDADDEKVCSQSFWNTKYIFVNNENKPQDCRNTTL